MNRSLNSLASLGLAVTAATMITVPRSEGHTLFVDLDGVTPGIQGSASVASGTIVTAIVGILADPVYVGDAPGAWDAVAMDITWGGFGAATATLTPTGAPLAGGIAGLAPTIADISTGPGFPPIVPGTPLASLGFGPQGFPPVLGGNLGGVGFLDTFAGVTYGGLGAAGALTPGTRIDVFTISFLATGLLGDSALIDPYGLMDPFGAVVGPAPVGGFAAIGAPGVGFTNAGGTPGTITIVPEPTTALLSLLGLGFLLRRKR